MLFFVQGFKFDDVREGWWVLDQAGVSYTAVSRGVGLAHTSNHLGGGEQEEEEFPLYDLSLTSSQLNSPNSSNSSPIESSRRQADCLVILPELLCLVKIVDRMTRCQ